jgi:hypothetical protein
VHVQQMRGVVGSHTWVVGLLQRSSILPSSGHLAWAGGSDFQQLSPYEGLHACARQAGLTPHSPLHSTHIVLSYCLIEASSSVVIIRSLSQSECVLSCT